MSPPRACGLLAFLPTRQANRPLHLENFARHIGTKDMSRAAHHVRRAEQAGLMRKIGWVGEWVAMTPEVSVSLFRRPSRVMRWAVSARRVNCARHNPARRLETATPGL
jgi:hypothetical protein